MGILRRVKVFSHFSPTGCSLVSRGDSVDFLPCRYSLRFLVDREDRIFSYFLRCQSLFISRGVDDVEEHPSLSGAREGEVCMKYKDHHTRHPRGHLGDRASAQGARGCAWRDDQFGRGQNPVLGWSEPHFCTRFRAQSDAWGRSSPRGDSFRCFARACRRILRRNMCRKRVNKVKTVRITPCTFKTATSSPNARPTEFILKRFPTATSAKVTAHKRVLRHNLTCYFTLDRGRHYENQSDESSRRTKLCAAQTAPGAGAPSPFDARCVTVAVWSLPPSQELRGRVLRACIHRPENLSDKKCDNLHENERRSPLSILKSPPKQPKAVTIQARVEESVKTQLELYAEFIDASPSYVITEALKLLFRKDDDFRRWADQHANNHDNGKAKGDVLAKTV